MKRLPNTFILTFIPQKKKANEWWQKCAKVHLRTVLICTRQRKKWKVEILYCSCTKKNKIKKTKSINMERDKKQKKWDEMKILSIHFMIYLTSDRETTRWWTSKRVRHNKWCSRSFYWYLSSQKKSGDKETKGKKKTFPLLFIDFIRFSLFYIVPFILKIIKADVRVVIWKRNFSNIFVCFSFIFHSFFAKCKGHILIIFGCCDRQCSAWAKQTNATLNNMTVMMKTK